MIPRIIHYCWFGQGQMPEMVQRCIASWHKYMPNWEYKLWNESNFDINLIPYTKEAYESRKYAFVSDYVRLWALEKEGGVYLDTDVEVFKPFDDLLVYHAFAGFEGSKHLPIGTCVMASEAHGIWAKEMLSEYQNRSFLSADGSFDLTTNVQFITEKMSQQGFVQNGQEQEYKDLHVFPVEYFSPRQTTGEFLKTDNTYCDHHFMGTWNDRKRSLLIRLMGPRLLPPLIKLKRKLFG